MSGFLTLGSHHSPLNFPLFFPSFPPSFFLSVIGNKYLKEGFVYWYCGVNSMAEQLESTEISEISENLVNKIESKHQEDPRVELRVRVREGAESDIMKKSVGFGSVSREDVEESLEEILEEIKTYNQVAEAHDERGIYRIEEVFLQEIKTRSGAFDIDISVGDL
jgi:hypothetical protein